MSADEFVADYDVRSPASRTLLTVVGTVLAVGVIGGLVLGTSILMRETTMSTTDIELVSRAQIVIDSGSSDLQIVQGSATDVVRVKASITSGLRKTDYQIGQRGNEIKIVSSCQAWLSPGCGAKTTVELPSGFPVVIRTTSGHVDVREVAEGVLTIVSGTGNISGTGLELDELSAETTEGHITAHFASQPFGFKATTTSGDVTASMPEGTRTYTVTTTSKSGDVSSDLRTQKGAKGFVRVATASGDIVLRAR